MEAEDYGKRAAKVRCSLCPAPIVVGQHWLKCKGCENRRVHTTCFKYTYSVSEPVKEWECSNCIDGNPYRPADPNISLRRGGGRRSKPRLSRRSTDMNGGSSAFVAFQSLPQVKKRRRRAGAQKENTVDITTFNQNILVKVGQQTESGITGDINLEAKYQELGTTIPTTTENNEKVSEESSMKDGSETQQGSSIPKADVQQDQVSTGKLPQQCLPEASLDETKAKETTKNLLKPKIEPSTPIKAVVTGLNNTQFAQGNISQQVSPGDDLQEVPALS